VTDVPAQTGLADAAIVTPAGSKVFTVIVIVFEVAGLPVTHKAFEVSSTVIASPLASAAEV
jgi:dienelactone hydrolase